MELREAILGRRSIRSFHDEPLPEGAVERMKEAMLRAPSAGNLQARRFLFVTNPETRASLAATTFQKKIFLHPPLVVVGCADLRIAKHYHGRGLDLYMLQDVAASIENLLLTVHSLGLGAVWIGAFKEEEVTRILGLPDHLRPVALVPVGVPAESPDPPRHISPQRAFVDLP